MRRDRAQGVHSLVVYCYAAIALALLLGTILIKSTPSLGIRETCTEPCTSPSLLIVILTSTRPESLQRLLSSLAAADYGCAQVDLKIYVDAHINTTTSTQELKTKTLETVTRFIWDQGAFDVVRRLAHAGLSQSWFESVYHSSKEYIAILDDDMEVSRHFYKMFEIIHTNGALTDSNVTGFCLHPNDWEVAVAKECHAKIHSKYLYLSPEPCNWGPIWKQVEWQKYLDWVFTARIKNPGFKPYVPEDIAYEFNKYLSKSFDVQSSWVWRFNFDFSKQQLRYTFKTCDVNYEREVYLAINHKEVGEHFEKKWDLNNDPSLLEFDITKSKSDLASEEAPFVPQRFTAYVKYARSMRG